MVSMEPFNRPGLACSHVGCRAPVLYCRSNAWYCFEHWIRQYGDRSTDASPVEPRHVGDGREVLTFGEREVAP